ncbi:MAG: hypothetical protein ISS54_07115 [Dehalococcoidia bacterium]|nr:hypothetical protein [Dehalococcoidia bacterium]
MEDNRKRGRIEDTNNQAVIARSISPAYLRAHIKELEDETCKILTKENASTVTISKMSEAGFFVPIMVIDVSEYNSGSFCNTGLFQVVVE